MIPDFNDIIFEKLNKEYGAYFLRRGYPRVLSVSIISAVVAGTVIVIIPFLNNLKHETGQVYTIRNVNFENLTSPVESGGKPSPVTPLEFNYASSAEKHISHELKYVTPKVVDSVFIADQSPVAPTDSATIIEDDKNLSNGLGDGTGTNSGTSVSGTGDGGTGGSGSGNGVFTKVDIMPTFKGGDINKFREWVQRKTKYPQEAEANGIHGKVIISFIVESDGYVKEVNVAQGVDPLIDNEALKSVKSSPRWTPGVLNGKTVRVFYYISVNFEL